MASQAPRNRYREFAPPAALAGHIACVWTRSTDDGANHAVTRVVPDGCVDLVWFHDATLFVAGPDTRSVIHNVPPSSEIVGVRLRPGMAPSLLGVPAHELLDARVPLQDLWGAETDRLASWLDGAPTSAHRLTLLTDLLVARLATARPVDDLVQAAITRIARQSAGGLRALSETLSISERQLRRRFTAAVGYGPKTLERVLRFQRLLTVARRPVAGRHDLATLAVEVGYADQAHMAREVTRLAGTTPRILLASA